MDTLIMRGFQFLVAGVVALVIGISEANARPLRVVAYNVWGLPSPFTVKPSRFKYLPEAVRRVEADILLLEETFTKRAAPLASLPEYPFSARGPAAFGVKQSSGLLLVSRFPIREQARWKFTRCAGTDCLANKGVVYAEVEIEPGNLVHVFGTHLSSDGSDRLRDHQVREILEFIRVQTAGKKGPALILGDFNFEPGSQPYFTLQLDAGFRDMHAAYREAQPGLPLVEWLGYTYDPTRNRNLRASAPFHRPSRIDFIFGRSDAGGCGSLQIQRSGLVFDDLVAGMHLSDHFGLQADFELERPVAGCL